jgi:type I restriction enzyme, S subunit
MSKFVKLKELCMKITDGSHYSPLEDLNGNYPMLSVKDMNQDYFDYSNCKYIGEEDYTKLVKADCKPLLNDVLIAKDGSYLKYIHVVEKEKEQAILSSIGIIRPNLKKVSPYFLKYYLQMDSIKKQVGKKYVSGTALPRIILKAFGEIEIIKKELCEQENIINLLVKLDKKIELNNNINQELETFAKTNYNYWFVQFDFPNEEGKPYKASGGQLVWNEEVRREVPSGWKIGNLSDIANITMGQSPEGETLNENQQGTVFYQGKTDFGWRFPEVRMYTTKPTRFAAVNDVLLSVRAPVGDINIANEDCCIGRGLAALNSKNNNSSFLFYTMLNLKNIFDIHNGNGTTFGAITKDDLYNIKIVIPNDSLLNHFEKAVKTYDELIALKCKENRELVALRDWLLPMLMNGQVTFKE